LLYFEQSKKVKIADVRKNKSLFNLIVKYEYYSEKGKGPTQCSNCQLFGHGSTNCHLVPKCVKCSQPHKSDLCVFNSAAASNSDKSKIPQEKFKCANCMGNTTDNYSKCPARLQYIAKQGRLQSNVTKINRHQFQPAPELNGFNYPTMSPGPAWQNHNYRKHVNQNMTHSETASTLLSPAECMEAFNELINKLSICSNRYDQLSVIGEVYICVQANSFLYFNY
jgi:hypothetical protein